MVSGLANLFLFFSCFLAYVITAFAITLVMNGIHAPRPEMKFTRVDRRDPVDPSGANGNGNGRTHNSFPNEKRAPAQQETDLDPSQRDDRDYPTNDQEKRFPNTPHGGSHNKNKIKRSESREREPGKACRSPVNRPTDSRRANPNGNIPGSVSEMERGNNSAALSHWSEGNDTGQTSANSPWSGYGSALIIQAQRAQQIDPSDVHLADAVQRVAGQEKSITNRPTPSAPQPSSPAYASGRNGTIRVAPKRKRVFSNRTKTGCI